MPELPEVETVVRDLRPRIVGARISGARMKMAGTGGPSIPAKGSAVSKLSTWRPKALRSPT